MESKKSNKVRVHRVGSITAGLSLVVWGVMFMLHEVHIIGNLDLVLKLWPLILIGLGGEILWSNAKEKKYIYDKGAVFLVILMAGFSLMMAFADVCMRYAATCIR